MLPLFDNEDDYTPRNKTSLIRFPVGALDAEPYFDALLRASRECAIQS